MEGGESSPYMTYDNNYDMLKSATSNKYFVFGSIGIFILIIIIMIITAIMPKGNSSSFRSERSGGSSGSTRSNAERRRM